MKMDEIRAIAKKLDIKPGRMNKAALIKTIQIKEGNVDCYKTITDCSQMDCCWRQICQK